MFWHFLLQIFCSCYVFHIFWALTPYIWVLHYNFILPLRYRVSNKSFHVAGQVWMARVLVGVVMTRNTIMTSLERCLQTFPHLPFLLSLNTRPLIARDPPWLHQCRSLRLHQAVGPQALCLQSLLREPQLYSSTHTSHSQEKVSCLVNCSDNNQFFSW